MLLCIYRAGAVLFAFAAGSNPHGLLNNGVLPFGVSCVLTIALLDLLRYGLHYLLHAVPMLWRVHRVHHSDRDMDLTTGLRSHPLEVLLTQGIYLGVIALLTPPVIAVAILELVSFVPELFAHANLAIPDWIDRRLRRFLITPDMHRVHHSEIFAEQNANF
jgi:sterol desaturase/sphingolipid hydroxylase (fatty acid hydroxylase superfamily)